MLIIVMQGANSLGTLDDLSLFIRHKIANIGNAAARRSIDREAYCYMILLIGLPKLEGIQHRENV